MAKEKSERNRTIVVNDNEIPELKKLVTVASDMDSKNIENTLINGDFYDCVFKIPDKSFDLIIVVPPYNLTKMFNSRKFLSMSDNNYENYLRSWFRALCLKLKPNGSLYMCGDWKCSSSMQKVISESLTVVNRITWQREKGRGAKANWKNGMEDIWFAVKDQKTTRLTWMPLW